MIFELLAFDAVHCIFESWKDMLSVYFDTLLADFIEVVDVRLTDWGSDGFGILQFKANLVSSGRNSWLIFYQSDDTSV